MQPVFTKWNNGKLESYLIEITRDILGYKDETAAPGREDFGCRRPKRHRQMDGISALDMGVPTDPVVEVGVWACT